MEAIQIHNIQSNHFQNLKINMENLIFVFCFLGHAYILNDQLERFILTEKLFCLRLVFCFSEQTHSNCED